MPPEAPIDQNLLPLADPPLVAQALQGDERRFRHGRRFGKRTVGRFQLQFILGNGYILGKTAPAATGQVPEHLVARPKLLHVSADRFDPARNVAPGYAEPRFQKPENEAERERLAADEKQVAVRQGCRMDFHQDVMVPGNGLYPPLRV